MKIETVNNQLNHLRQEYEHFQTEAKAFDVPWSVPYDFSTFANERLWEIYGQTEKFWAENEIY